MELLAEKIDADINPGLTGGERKVGFILMVFPFGPLGDKKRLNMVSNARSDAIPALLEEHLAYVRERLMEDDKENAPDVH